MPDSLVPLFVGFLLTTVLGGVLGYYFQTRSWRHQNTARVLETELQTALKVFDDISRLMDKRLYRMRLLFWRLSDSPADQETIEKFMNLYREVLFDWNDNLNRHLALVQCYFGDDIREQIDYDIYEQFKTLGNLLEQAYRRRIAERTTGDLAAMGDSIETLSRKAYHLNIQMIRLIQLRNVGIYYKGEKATQQ
jgi:hypothetical protein